jgi:hypothetical protein
VLVNGFQSLAFDICQGVCHGDPLSPLLFNLAIEPLLSCFQHNLEGLRVPELAFKVSAFADDILLGLGSGQDFKIAQDCLVLYASASNAKLNNDKCLTLQLGGGGGGGMPVLGELLGDASVFKYLGVPFHPKCFPLPVVWYEKLLTDLTHVISMWQKQHIILSGCIHVLNSCLLSKLWYLSYFVSWSPWFLKRLKQLVTTFLWDTKKPQVSYATLCGTKEVGGLGLIDPGLQAVALKGWWLHRMGQGEVPRWMDLAILNLKECVMPAGWTISFLLTTTQD